MYRQIWIKPEQRGLQCILWRTKEDQPMETFQLNTVTFGIASSPYLATRCLKQLSEDVKESHPLSSRGISDDFYVDDMLTGDESEAKIIEIRNEVTSILHAAGFELQKIFSNVDGFSHGNDEHEITEIKTLGLRWRPGDDRLRYHTSEDVESTQITKRNILSIISQIFDPLGLIGPFTVRSKLLIQLLWKLKLDWDSPIPNDLEQKWILHCRQLRDINDIDIPRHMVGISPQTIQIHGFCDASEVVYGACLYMRTIDHGGAVVMRLVCARSRVAPLKSMSLPRLELCGAVLLATLYIKVREALTVNVNDSYFWSDSTIALAWIKGESSRWQTFVSNRVAEIQRLTSPDSWNHVPTDQNPVDLVSRGMDSRDLASSMLWWKGPHWLQDDIHAWPQTSVHMSDIPEEKKVILTFAAVEKRDFSILERFSSWKKLRRVVAYCLRFKENLWRKLKKNSLICGHLSAEELSAAETAILRLHQQEEFARELSHLQHNQLINRNSKLLSLNPFLDNKGLIRVGGGRLTHAPLSYSQRFPIILSTSHVITELIIRDCHYRNLHAGASLLAATLRENYWILSARSAIRRVLRRCILCFRLKPVTSTQLMGNLPDTRITPSRAFAHTGLDYAGPFNINTSINVTSKAYLCVFVCMAVKAVHLELVSSLTTDAFLNALKRFIARRGKCLTLMSDNGKNFVGAHNELRKIVTGLLSDTESNSKIMNFVTDNSINWRFIPPYSPHMGGLWEAAVKSAKSHLKAVISDTPLTFEELYTVIVQIEAILNSRPLYPLSSDVNDLNALTPGHFLIGTPLNSILEEDVREIPVNRTNRFQLLCQMQQSFWQRWSAEYVTQLQSRSKWKEKNNNEQIRVGQMVVIKDDNLPPLRWQLGRIANLHPSKDGMTRVISVKTRSGIVKRSLPKICILPIENEC